MGGMMMHGPRACESGEFDGTLELLNTVFYRSGRAAHPLEQLCPHLYNEENMSNMRVIEDSGVIVAHAAIKRAKLILGNIVLETGAIGGVATHPDHRGKGYAGLIMQDCIQEMKKTGCEISILWSGTPDLYRKFGWENASRAFAFTIDKGNSFLLSDVNLQVGGDQSGLEVVKRLHEKEPLRVAREITEYRTLFAIPDRELFVGFLDGTAQAYLLVDKKRQTVLEYGGAPENVLSLARCLVDGNSFASLTMVTPGVEDGVPGRLKKIGAPCAERYLGMIKLVDAIKVARKLGYAEESMQGVEERKAVKMLFGPEVIAGSRGALPIFWWPSEHV